ncbi:MAG: ComF family protein [Acidimicrobiia bacterium]|nr:ComF family protein [Acidimicrobiia bacterium]
MTSQGVAAAAYGAAMPCVTCGGESPALLCNDCRRLLRPVPVRWIAGLVVHSAFVHEGPARQAVLRGKYRAAPAGEIGRVLAPLLPAHATALVPIPRVMARRWRYGVDPAFEIARSIAGVTGLPVVAALRAPLWVHRRAGSRAARHGVPRFTLIQPVPPGAVLIDDVVTTGATLRAAAGVTGIRSAVTVTAAVRG